MASKQGKACLQLTGKQTSDTNLLNTDLQKILKTDLLKLLCCGVG